VPPKPAAGTEITGIFQSDIAIRNALMEAIADLRRNSWLLDFVFAGVPQDTLTADKYGTKDVKAAKKWFLSTNIPVMLNVLPNAVKFPCVSIALSGSAQDQDTLGDVHYQPEEAVQSDWPILAAQLTPTSWIPSTGTIVFNPNQLGFDADGTGGLIVVPGMVVVDSTGNSWPILGVVDYQTVQIQPNVNTNLTGCQIRSSQPGLIATVESSVFRETYVIGCHVQSEPVWLVYLHSIIAFCLLRYKQRLIEGRGYEISTFSSSDFSKNNYFGDQESVYSRFITVSGICRQVWPKDVVEAITDVEFQPTLLGSQPVVKPTDSVQSARNQAWLGEGDADPWSPEFDATDDPLLGPRIKSGQ
jgi:hypothetical protein